MELLLIHFEDILLFCRPLLHGERLGAEKRKADRDSIVRPLHRAATVRVSNVLELTHLFHSEEEFPSRPHTTFAHRNIAFSMCPVGGTDARCTY